MAEYNAVHRYQDENYGDGSDDTTDTFGGKNKPNKQPRIRMRNTEARSGSLFSIVLISLLAVAILGSVIYSLDRRNTMYNKVSALNAELSLAEAENVRLQSELDNKMSAKNVEDYAENVLGMQKIDSSQIKYIKIQTDDVVNIPHQDEGIIGKVRDFFDRCVEYFRG